MATDVAQPAVDGVTWETGGRKRSEPGYNTSNEQLALIGFANRLGSSIINNEAGIADERDVRREARLLMSLSCSSPTNISEEFRSVSPSSETSSSCRTTTPTPRRDSFTFTCPSLSLENPSQAWESLDDDETLSKLPPAALLGRILKVEDRDALRLSAEAMARNVMQSYKKAIEWRIKSWVDSLSRVLVRKEMELKKAGASQEETQALLQSNEALLVMVLRELVPKITVLDVQTSFKVLPQRVPHGASSEPLLKKLRMEGESELQETDYKYAVAHSLSMDCILNVYTPAGYGQIDLQVPGTINGTFLSSEHGDEELTAVLVELNTDMLASMIERSSRLLVRSSAEAVLNPQVKMCVPKDLETPKRVVTDDRTAGLMVVTPAQDASSPTRVESDNDEKPIILSIPNDFKGSVKSISRRPSSHKSSQDFGTTPSPMTPRPSTRTETFPSLVSPHQVMRPNQDTTTRPKGKGPYLPVLVEVACAAMRSN